MFNIIFFVILLICLLRGVFSKAGVELVNLVLLSGCVVLAILYHRQYYLIPDEYIGRPSLSKVLTFVIILIIAPIVGSFINLLTSLSERRPANFISRALAGVLSLGKGMVINFAVFVIVQEYLSIFSEELNQSFLTPYFSGFYDVIRVLS